RSWSQSSSARCSSAGPGAGRATGGAHRRTASSTRPPRARARGSPSARGGGSSSAHLLSRGPLREGAVVEQRREDAVHVADEVRVVLAHGDAVGRAGIGGERAQLLLLVARHPRDERVVAEVGVDRALLQLEVAVVAGVDEHGLCGWLALAAQVVVE